MMSPVRKKPSSVKARLVASCCIFLGQFYPFGESTGAPRHCLGTPDLLEKRNEGLEKSYTIVVVALKNARGLDTQLARPIFGVLTIRIKKLRMSVGYEKLAHPALICLPLRMRLRPRKPEYEASTLGDAHQTGHLGLLA